MGKKSSLMSHSALFLLPETHTKETFNLYSLPTAWICIDPMANIKTGDCSTWSNIYIEHAIFQDQIRPLDVVELRAFELNPGLRYE